MLHQNWQLLNQLIKAKDILKFSKVFAKYWTSDNPLEQYENKQIQCAEDFGSQ
mgnify:CR=1 FL=1